VAPNRGREARKGLGITKGAGERCQHRSPKLPDRTARFPEQLADLFATPLPRSLAFQAAAHSTNEFSICLQCHRPELSTSSGQIVWDIDTRGDFSGVAARGGSLDGPGPVIVGGMLYVNSGYTNFGTAPGNVLLAFSVDGK
jgi:hypothetical protein